MHSNPVVPQPLEETRPDHLSIAASQSYTVTNVLDHPHSPPGALIPSGIHRQEWTRTRRAARVRACAGPAANGEHDSALA
jgi:hypothetical protein